MIVIILTTHRDAEMKQESNEHWLAKLCFALTFVQRWGRLLDARTTDNIADHDGLCAFGGLSDRLWSS